MNVETILTNIAIIFLTVTVWNYLQQAGQLTPARRTWLTIAGIFAAVSLFLRVLGR